MTTTALVPVFTGILAGQPTQLCNARDLHGFLEVGDRFDQWISRRIETYGFADGEDFCTKLCKTRGRPATDYHLTLDTAKELAMVENNDKGRQVRRYFIQIEKEARKVGAGETALAAYITPEQQGVLFNIVARRSGDSGAIRPYMWSRFQNHFQVNSYKNLPASRFDEAVAYLEAMPMKGEKTAALPALPTPVKTMKPPVVTKTAGSHTGATRNLNTVKQLITELQMWGYDELPRDVANAFHECLYELNALLVTGWTEVDEALQCLHRAQRYLSRWQGSPI